MQSGRGFFWFVFLVACAAAFIVWSSEELPAVVASHLGPGGVADEFMKRAFYVGFMLVFIIGLPVLLVVLTALAFGGRTLRINIPNRSYWLAPERRTEAVAFLRAGVGWLVVLANRSQRARLAEPWFIGGPVAFFIGLIALVAVLFGHFRKNGPRHARS